MQSSNGDVEVGTGTALHQCNNSNVHNSATKHK